MDLNWHLDAQYKKKDDHYYVKVLDDSKNAPCVSLRNCKLYNAPSITNKHTTFRLRTQQDLRMLFEYIQEGFVSSLIEPFYKKRFGKALDISIVEDCMQYIRHQGKKTYVHLRIYEPFESFAELDTHTAYTFDVQLKGIHVSASKLQLDWKLLQVCADTQEPLFKEVSEVLSDDNDNDDVFQLCEEDEHEAYVSLLQSLKCDMHQLQDSIAKSNERLVALQHLTHVLEKDRTLATICKVYEQWVSIIDGCA